MIKNADSFLNNITITPANANNEEELLNTSKIAFLILQLYKRI